MLTHLPDRTFRQSVLLIALCSVAFYLIIPSPPSGTNEDILTSTYLSISVQVTAILVPVWTIVITFYIGEKDAAKRRVFRAVGRRVLLLLTYSGLLAIISQLLMLGVRLVCLRILTSLILVLPVLTVISVMQVQRMAERDVR